MSTEQFSIFILKTSAQSLRQAETYLRNRKWTVGSGANMRDALAYIIQKQPQFILVAADHPNKKVRVLPRLLAQAFPIRVIAFSENSSPSSMLALREMAQTYTLFAPVSGPAIERMVLKIKKELDSEEENRKNLGPMFDTTPNSVDSNNTIRFKGEGSSEEASKSFEQARAALNQMVNSKEDDDTGPAYMPDHTGNNPSSSTSGYIPFNSSSPENQPKVAQEGPQEGESFEAWQDRIKKTLAYKSQTQGPSAQDDSATSSGATDEHSSDWEGYTPTPTDQGYKPKNPPKPHGKQTPTMESDYVGKKKAKNALYVRGDEKADPTRESIVIKGSVDALETTVVNPDDLPEDQIQKIEASSNVACITIESPRFSGYLVAALGKNRKIDKDFIDSVKKKLFAFLKANGEQVNDDDSMGMKIKEVEFEDWAVEQAEFLKKSVHDGNEVAMAFFPNDQTKLTFEASASEKMVKMSVEELKEDISLEFDLYMFLPENNKYLLYTPQGMPFYGNQKGRLKEKGITHMHLRKESIGEVKKYRAQNFLNEKIEAYRQAKNLKRRINS